MTNNQTLLEIWRRELEAAGWRDGPINTETGSTDMANVSHEVPTIHPEMAIAPEGTPGHSREFAAHAGGPDGDAMLPIAIRVLAATAVELVEQPGARGARVGRAVRGRGGPPAEAVALSDILAGHASDAELLAEIYDLEHDEIDEDLAFYREWARRSPGSVIDLGCGSGRLFEPLLAGGATRIVGVDGSPSLLDRAAARVQSHASLRQAHAPRAHRAHRRRRPHGCGGRDRFALAILAGVISHLDGPEDALRALAAARRLLEPDGTLIVDVLGPGGLPPHDLPLSLDWERTMGDRRVVRRSRLERREAPEGLRVTYATLTDVVRADGTIARLPASFRLWYPTAAALVALAGEAELAVVAVYGSHDLEGLDDDSERCIVVARPKAVLPETE